MSYSQQNTDHIEKARQASLADFFTQNGFETELSRNELHVKGYGGLYVNTETNEWYCFSQAEKHGGRKFISSNNLTQRNHILKEFGVKDFNELLVKITKLQQKTEKRPLNRKHDRH